MSPGDLSKSDEDISGHGQRVAGIRQHAHVEAGDSAHVKLGRTEKAIATYEKALKLKMNPRSRAKAEAELKKLKKTGDAAKLRTVEGDR